MKPCLLSLVDPGFWREDDDGVVVGASIVVTHMLHSSCTSCSVR